ncbi:MAG: hypothetical protein D6732_11845 [Methanobacteriota archaeon]|nr:MAG: hypothetical protein D6732_11845 [Euryarchaeota archaeon]
MVFFMVVAILRLISFIEAVFSDFLDLAIIIQHIFPYLAFMFSLFIFYLAIFNPAFLLFSHQQVIRALQTAKVIQKMKRPVATQRDDLHPDEIISYLKKVERLIREVSE